MFYYFKTCLILASILILQRKVWIKFLPEIKFYTLKSEHKLWIFWVLKCISSLYFILYKETLVLFKTNIQTAAILSSIHIIYNCVIFTIAELTFSRTLKLKIFHVMLRARIFIQVWITAPLRTWSALNDEWCVGYPKTVVLSRETSTWQRYSSNKRLFEENCSFSHYNPYFGSFIH